MDGGQAESHVGTANSINKFLCVGPLCRPGEPRRPEPVDYRVGSACQNQAWGPQPRDQLCLRGCSGQVRLGWGTAMGRDWLDGTGLRNVQISAFST